MKGICHAIMQSSALGARRSSQDNFAVRPFCRLVNDPIIDYFALSPINVIELSVNGAVKRIEPGASVARLLESLDLAGKRIAVERNGEIVPRSRYAETALAEGDRLEIVVAVGGG